MPLLKITAPLEGGQLCLPVTAESTLAFDFDLSQAVFEREGTDLIIGLPGGASVRLEDLFVLGKTPGQMFGLPAILLEDGSIVDAGDFLRGLDPSMDVTPAAGPSAGSASGGIGEYAGDPGLLVEGIDRLGALGTTRWSAELPEGEDVVYSAAATAGQTGQRPDQEIERPDPQPKPEPEPEPKPEPEPEPEAMPYHTRLVVTDTDENSFSFQAVDENGNLVTDASLISLSFKDGSEFFRIVGIDPATGKITVELTPAGLAALAEGRYAADLLSVSVGGKEYNMPLVINNEQRYDFIEEEDRADLGTDLKAEWYASEGSTVNETYIVLGGTEYNNVDISRANDSGTSIAARNLHIDTSYSRESDINISAESSGAAYGLATYGQSGAVSSHVQGNSLGSNINIGATSTGSGNAYGVFNSTYDGADSATTTIAGNKIDIQAHSEQGGAYGLYGTHSRDAGTYVYGQESVDIEASSGQVNRGGASVHGVAAYNNALISINLAMDGKLVVKSQVASSDQYTYDVAQGGFFAATGLSAKSGGMVNLLGSDITVEAGVGMDSANGTAAAVYSGYRHGDGTRSSVNITGHGGRDNEMTFTARAPDMAFGVIATNGGDVTIMGSDRDDRIVVNTEAENGSAVGLAAQTGGSKVIVHGGYGGNDTLEVNSRFTGTQDGRNLDLFQGGKGAYGMAAAWAEGWGDGDAVSAQVRVDGFDKVKVTADATGSNGYAYGIYTRSAYQQAPGVYIKNEEEALDLNITAKADDPAKAYAIYNNGGTVSIQGGSQAGGPGDKIELNGNVHIATNTGKNLIQTGDGNDSVNVNGNVSVGINNTLNSISTGEGDDTVRISGNVSANHTSGRNVIDTGRGDDQVHIGGVMGGVGQNSVDLGEGNNQASFGGLNAQGGSALNEIRSGNDNDRLSLGNVSSANGGTNQVYTGEGDDLVTLNGYIEAKSGQNSIMSGQIQAEVSDGSTWWVKAMNATEDENGQGATNTLNARGDVNLSYTNTWGHTYGLNAETGENSGGSAYNMIDGENVKLSFTATNSGYAAGLNASGSAGNVVNARGAAELEVAANGGGWAYGLRAVNNASNQINGESVKLGVNVNGGSAVGLEAGGSSFNQLNSRSDVEVSLGATGDGHLYGMKASDSGSNVVTAAGDVDLSLVSSGNGYLQGMDAAGGSNNITSDTGDITLTAHSGTADNTVSRTDLLSATDSGMNYLNATEGGITLEAVNQGSLALGLYSEGQYARNELHAKNDINISALSNNSRGHEAGGIYANQGSTAILVSREGSLNVSAEAVKGGTAYGISGSNNSVFHAAKDIKVDVDASLAASGLSGGGSYYAGNAVEADVLSLAGTATGVRSQGKSATDIHAGSFSLSVESRGAADTPAYDNARATGIHTYDQSGTSIRVRDLIDVNVKAGGAGDVYGVRTERPNSGADTRTLLEGDKINLNAVSTGDGDVYGLSAYGVHYDVDNGAINEIRAGSQGFALKAEAGGGAAYGLHAERIGALNSVASDGLVDIDVLAQGDAYGLYAADSGANSIVGGNLSIQVSSGQGSAYGLYAGRENYWGETVNSIQAASGGGITVVIQASGAERAVALWAEGYGAVNRIQGDLKGDYADHITLQGEIYAANGGKNIIETGGGDDTIHLHGQVHPGALNIMAGEGNDLLVLTASSAEEFNQFYKDWLDWVKDNNLDMSVEKVTVNLEAGVDGSLGDLESLAWLKTHFGEVSLEITGSSGDDYLNFNAADYSGLIFNGGQGDDTIRLSFDEAGPESGLADSLGGFLANSQLNGLDNLVLDLENGGSDSLSLSDLLEPLSQAAGNTYIRGDAGDVVNLGLNEGAGWSVSEQPVRVDGIDYHSYSNDDTILYIQMGLIVN